MWQKFLWPEIEWEFSRSRGAGGQHVNRTESAAVARWNLEKSYLFTEEQKNRLWHKLASQLTKENELLVRSEEHRERLMNQKQAFQKLIKIIDKALHQNKVRKKTKPTKSSKQKRLSSKKILSEKKTLRQKVSND